MLNSNSGWHLLTTNHTVLLATHSSMPFYLYSSAAEHHRTLTGTYFPSCWEQEAELAWVARWNTEVACPPKDGHPFSISRDGRESSSRP